MLGPKSFLLISAAGTKEHSHLELEGETLSTGAMPCPSRSDELVFFVNGWKVRVGYHYHSLQRQQETSNVRRALVACLG